MLGGKIWVQENLYDPKPQKGVEFCFTIPFNTGIEPDFFDKKSDEEEESRSDLYLKKLRILIVEDDEASEILFTKLLIKHSIYILKAKSGTQAIEICRSAPDLDLILMDIKMPGMDGYITTGKIREFNDKVIIIAQTAYAQRGDQEKAIQAGCNDFLSKPISKNLLLSTLQKHFGTYK
jgi:CheY-like chemotaxis protein